MSLPLAALMAVVLAAPRPTLETARTRRAPAPARAAAERARRPSATANPMTVPLHALPHLCSATQVAVSGSLWQHKHSCMTKRMQSRKTVALLKRRRGRWRMCLHGEQ